MDAIKELTQINYGTLIISICTILLAFKFMWTLFDWFIKLLGLETRSMRLKREEHELLIATSKALNELKEKECEDTKQAIKHDQMIKKNLAMVSETMIQIKEEVTLMRTLRDNDKLAEYKDKVGQGYRFYKQRKFSDEEPIPYWNHMEKEALEGLIQQYESHGGSNSFVHSIVEPEMQTWKLID